MISIPQIHILIIVAIVSIFSIASTSIGVQAFNENESWKKEHKGNFGFLIINLVVSIIVLILSLVAMGLRLRN